MELFQVLSRDTSTKLAEIGFLLIVIAGIWMIVAEIQPLRFHKVRLVVVGAALAVAGILLIIAIHWGTFG